jgi:hypothetical protein
LLAVACRCLPLLAVALTFVWHVQHGVVSSSFTTYSALLHLAPALARPDTVPVSTALDSALQTAWVSALTATGELQDLITAAVTELRAERHKRRRDPTSACRAEDSSDDEDLFDVVNNKRIRTLAFASGTVPGGVDRRRDLRNKTKKESLKPMAAPLLASHPITDVSPPCIDATAASDHLALHPPQLKLALVKYVKVSPRPRASPRPCVRHRLCVYVPVCRDRAAAVCVNASLAYAGIEHRVPDEPDATALRSGLSALVGRLLLIPGRPNLRTDKATKLQICGPRNSARTTPFDAGTRAHPVAMQPVVWILRDSNNDSTGDDACLALLLPLCEEGYNLSGSGRVRLPAQSDQFDDVWLPCAVLYVYGPEYHWSNFQPSNAGLPAVNPWARGSRMLLPGEDDSARAFRAALLASRDFFGWGLFREGASCANDGGRMLSVAKMQQGSTRSLGPDVPIYVGAGVLRRLRDSGGLDDALRTRVFSNEKLKKAMDDEPVCYNDSFDEDLKQELGISIARRAANPCGLDLRMYLLQEVLLQPTPLAPLLTKSLVDTELLENLLPSPPLNSVPALWAKIQAAAAASTS